ncbi:methyltransferase domain-containing protein [Amylocarpus encephaloides]|uniref:Protein-lysine N-methyltransferase EFM4 n=1 Tax=Amylocarpus encephaloides TaxID=45428 RepID=A0A9P7YGZ8_9HELO|nr:methyltransferase domain-containing protein [Amylocarpus encephaloides]
MMTSSKPSHLEPSPLGTKEYWDDLYTTELTNHALDTSDVGTIWFNDSSAEDKILPFLNQEILENGTLGPSINRTNCSFLDLGTGNGHLLFRLRCVSGDEDENEEPWEGKMLGVDYSEKSVEFAKRIAEGHGLGTRDVEFKWWDIVSQIPTAASILGEEQESGFDVVLDKGTFDAISLSEEKDAQGRRICEGYKEKVVPLIRPGGIFLVTSCNWTTEELKGWFEGGEGEMVLTVVGEIAYKRFTFGGAVGQTISSVCFKRKLR